MPAGACATWGGSAHLRPPKHSLPLDSIGPLTSLMAFLQNLSNGRYTSGDLLLCRAPPPRLVGAEFLCGT